MELHTGIVPGGTDRPSATVLRNAGDWQDGGVEQPVPQDARRVSDADRGMVAGQLKKAHAEGRLDLDEFDERTRKVWEARTFGELAAVTSDLPDVRQPVPWSRSELVPEPTIESTSEVVRRPRGPGATVMRVATGAWFAASLVNFVIWLIVVFSDGLVYPWWIWVAGPWGALLVAGYILGIGRDNRS
ncbi:DUF1707 domain-containing protein [Kutzneria sp. CA-103260]|uniref:DUF1707 domain-containing protein n=1 Tax=Kutzneria sp. CA-103260 TaxID=2802641 RepID=UPI001BA88C7A